MNRPLYDALIAAKVSHELALAAAESVANKQTVAEMIAETEQLLRTLLEKLNKRRRDFGIDD